MRQSERIKRLVEISEERFVYACDAHDEGATVGQVVRHSRLPKSTFLRKYKERTQQNSSPGQGRTALKAEEENRVFFVIKLYSTQGFPLTQKDIMDVVELMAAEMPPARRFILPFRNGRPGRKFVRCFLSRHRDVLVYRKPLRQVGQRFRAVNAQIMTTHLAAIGHLIKEHNLDA